MLQLGLAYECCEPIHIELVIQGRAHAYNVSSQLVSSIKGMFTEKLNVRKVMQVNIVNAFCLHGMETMAFHQLHHSHHSGTVSCQQYEVILVCARHKFRVPSIHSHIQFVFDL